MAKGQKADLLHDIIQSRQSCELGTGNIYGKVRIRTAGFPISDCDFRGCDPAGGRGLKPISLVAKVTSANGRPAVKLSDNPSKATGESAEIERYLRIFGQDGRVHQAVAV
ncbi:hypothetical protein [Sphingomonas psychrotolerans]|uniref:hypothetical protein n=1 Tax=Sphingomonas psychrotolerans TaxID=1327635 RepID=UPI00389A9186